MIKKHFAVIGDPISHSLSPLLHQTGFDIYFSKEIQTDCEYSYVAYHVKKEELSVFMRMFRGEIANSFIPLSDPLNPPLKAPLNPLLKTSIKAPLSTPLTAPTSLTAEKSCSPYVPMSGLSVTLPHKKDIMAYADIVTMEAQLAGAANTLYWDGTSLIADNTDIVGFLAPLKTLPTPKSVLVLGAGGAAAAVLVGLLQLAYTQESSLQEIYVCARREEQAKELIAHILRTTKQHSSQTHIAQTYIAQNPTFHVLPFSEREKRVDWIINTIPASLGGQSFSPRENFENVCLAYDLLYADTPFIKAAQKAHVHAITGEEMFLEQGAQQFLLWTKKRIPNEAFEAVKEVIKRKK